MCAYCVIIGMNLHSHRTLFSHRLSQYTLTLFIGQATQYPTLYDHWFQTSIPYRCYGCFQIVAFVLHFLPSQCRGHCRYTATFQNLPKPVLWHCGLFSVIIITVLIEGPKIPPEIRGEPVSPLDFIRNEVFQAIGVMSFGKCKGILLLRTIWIEKGSTRSYNMKGTVPNAKRNARVLED